LFLLNNSLLIKQKKLFTNNMNKEMYLEILNDQLIPFAEGRYGSDWVLHQDNDPKHTSQLCRNFLHDEKVLWVSEFT
jgi:hypothetical protein